MNNLIYINDLDINDIIDEDFDETLELDDANVDGNPFNSNIPNNFNIVYENNHISILNSSNFNISFQIIYTLGEKNITLNSGEFLPLYTRQIPFTKEASFIYLIINSINSSKEEAIIYHANLGINKNYKFTVNGDLDNATISEN